jgi:hypothetical protein
MRVFNDLDRFTHDLPDKHTDHDVYNDGLDYEHVLRLLDRIWIRKLHYI